MSDTDSGQSRRGQPSRFGELLLGYRRATGLTQEELAEKSGLSVRALRNLERGDARSAQRDSAALLADALDLRDERRTEFVREATDARRRSTAVPRAPAGPLPRRSLAAPPAVVAHFVGRDRELDQLASWARTAIEAPGGTVVSIVGPPGIGKTTLAVVAARRLTARFPDGCLAVDLRGMDDQPLPPGVALDRMLRAMDVGPEDVPRSVAEQSNLFRSLLAGQRVLILLDNATDEAQVRPLLATSPGCLTLITCRRTLSGLEGARWLWLDVLTPAQAVELVASIADPERVHAEPAAARELVELCGNLPLAVRIVGNRLARQPHWSLADLAGQLRDERTRLTALTAGDLQVRSAFAVSYQRLSEPARRMFRRLALVPGVDFGVELAAVAAGVTPAEAERQLDELVETTLVQPASVPGRYQFHDLIRLFTAERLSAEETDAQRQCATDAVHEHLLDRATTAGLLFDPDTSTDAPIDGLDAARERAAEWLEREYTNWFAAARHALPLGRQHQLIALARAMHWYSDAHQQYPWADLFAWAVEAARAAGDRHAEALLLNFLGWAKYICFDDNDGQVATHRLALATAVDIGDRREEAWAHLYLGSALTRLGALDDALAHTEHALDLFTELDYWPALNSTRNGIGRLMRMLGRYEEGLAVHRAVLADLGRREGELAPRVLRYHRGFTLSLIGQTLLEQGQWSGAAVTFASARELFNPKEVPRYAGEAAFHEGQARRMAGEPVRAVECLRLALTLFTGASLPWWRARALAELAGALRVTGAVDEAGRYRGEALALCRTLDTDDARRLAADLSADSAE